MLKLIVDNTHSSNGKVLSQKLETKLTIQKSLPQNSFLVDFQELSLNLYVFRAQDLNHKLACEITLELKEGFVYSKEESEEDEYLVPIIACNFPSIDLQRFNEKVGWDEYLQGILIIQFQLKILEQLFLFCEVKNAVNLLLTINNAKFDYLEIYRRFFISEKQVITARGRQTEIVMPTDVETYDKMIAFMDEVNKDFRQTLWCEQKNNAAFRKYLKEHSLSV